MITLHRKGWEQRRAVKNLAYHRNSGRSRRWLWVLSGLSHRDGWRAGNAKYPETKVGYNWGRIYEFHLISQVDVLGIWGIKEHIL